MSGDLSASCSHLTLVSEALHSRADIKDLPEILWNFSHFEGEQCLTLVQNPHFYENLPMSPDAYVGTFKGECIENRLPDKIFVPTNSSRRVYFDFTGNQRVFDVWKTTNSALIFKGTSFILAFSCPWLICFQTFAETSRAKPSLKALPFPVHPISNIAGSIRRVLLKALRLRILMIGRISSVPVPQTIPHVPIYALGLAPSTQLIGRVGFVSDEVRCTGILVMFDRFLTCVVLCCNCYASLGLTLG